MAKQIWIRHSFKGNGTDAPTNLLSPKGIEAAAEFGANLKNWFLRGEETISYIGGSSHSRSLHTAITIAHAAGQDPKVLASNSALGDESQFWAMTDKALFMENLKNSDNAMMETTRTMLSTGNYNYLKGRMLEYALECSDLGNIILATHAPWLQLFFEAVTGVEYNGNAAELDYVVVEVSGGKITLIETSLVR